MNLAKTLLITCLVIFVSAACCLAQCAGKINIEKSKIETSGKGSLSVKIESKGLYEISLLKAGDTELKEIPMEVKTGSGNQTFRFENLSMKDQFKVAVKFESETRPVCANKKTEYIVFKK